MGSLTVNLHLLMSSFYRPAGRKRKILIEQGAFPPDRYAVVAQLGLHGLDPQENLIVMQPDKNDLSAAWREPDIIRISRPRLRNNVVDIEMLDHYRDVLQPDASVFGLLRKGDGMLSRSC